MKNIVFIFIILGAVNIGYSQVTPTCSPVDIVCGFDQGGTVTGQFSNQCTSSFILNAGVYEATACVSTSIGTNDTFQIDENVTINGDLILDLNALGSVFEILSGNTLEITGNLIIIGNSNLERQLSIEGNLIVGGILDFGERGGGSDQDVEIDGGGSITAGSVKNGGNTTCEDSGSCPAFNVTGSCEPAGSGLCTEDALPIELSLFEVRSLENEIEIKWITATEQNNDFFTIEKSRDGKNFEVVSLVEGAGTSFEPLRYVIVDANPYYGQSYYRLTQTDFDGTSETFDPKGIYLSGISEVNIFPNPVVGGENFTINHTAQDGEIVTIHLYNSAGSTVLFRTLSTSEQIIELNESIEPGFYILKIKSGLSQSIKRVLIK